MIDVSIKKQLHAANGHFDLELDLQIEKGSFVSIFGKSGAGKTSLLKLLAGLMKPESGEIKVKNQTWFNQQKKHPFATSKDKYRFCLSALCAFPEYDRKGESDLRFESKKSKNDRRIDRSIRIR